MTITEAPDQTTTSAAAAWTPASVLDAAHRIADMIRPTAGERDVDAQIPGWIFEQLKATGLTAALVPTEHGGAGVTHAQMGEVLRVVGAADASVALTLSMHSHLVGAQVWRHKHGIDASAVFAKVIDGAILISTGASDWLTSNGTARKVDDGWVVSARKSPASGCEHGTVLVTSLRWDDAPDGPQVLHCSVPFAAKGISIDPTWNTTGLRATGSHTVVLDEVFVPEAAVSLVRPADVWHPVFNVVVGTAMPLIMAPYLGIADAAVAEAVRAVNGSTDTTIDSLVGEMINEHTQATDAVTAMFSESSNLEFANEDTISASTLSRKTNAVAALNATVDLAVALCGGRSFSRGSVMERLARDVRGAQFHPLPKARQLELTGRVVRGTSPAE